ncbi:hypothetical protein SZ66_04285 [Pantoea ananatis]|nr:hypothetical protein [Pantoea ananatis]
MSHITKRMHDDMLQPSELNDLQAFRLSGFQAFRLSGFQAFRLSGFQAFRLSGINLHLETEQTLRIALELEY